jgi:IS66 Orf2 like protein
MILLPRGLKVHLALGYTDMRKGIDGLAMLVQAVLHQDPRSRGSSSSFGGSNGRSSDGARNGSMATSLLSDWKTLMPISRAYKRANRQHRRTMSIRSLRHIGKDFLTICRAKMWRSILMSASAPAAAARSMSSARRSARCSTSCRHGCEFCASDVPNTVAVPAARSTRLPRLSVPSPREWRARACWRMCW